MPCAGHTLSGAIGAVEPGAELAQRWLLSCPPGVAAGFAPLLGLLPVRLQWALYSGSRDAEPWSQGWYLSARAELLHNGPASEINYIMTENERYVGVSPTSRSFISIKNNRCRQSVYLHYSCRGTGPQRAPGTVLSLCFQVEALSRAVGWKLVPTGSDLTQLMSCRRHSHHITLNSFWIKTSISQFALVS